MNRYLEGEELTVPDLREAAHRAIALGKLVPIICVSAKKDIGVQAELTGAAHRLHGLNLADVHHVRAFKGDARLRRGRAWSPTRTVS